MKLAVPGARLHWQEAGSGPLLIVLQGGDGDADTSQAMVARLEGFRVITYDRRGLSRTEVDAPGKVELRTHTDDVAALLASLTDEPAFVFGSSMGGVMGLDLISRYPRRVKKLVVHEPPLTELLGEADRASSDQVRDEIASLHQTRGIAAAMRRFIAATGVDFMDREADVGLPPFNPGRLKNLDFFLANDAPAVWRFKLELPALRRGRARIVVAAGAKSKALWIHRSAQALAAALELGVEELPGDHGGYVSHPRGFAETLKRWFG